MATASPLPTSPSDALASLAAVMAGFVVQDFEELDRELEALDPGYDAPEEWQLSAIDLCDSVTSALGVWPPEPPRNASRFAEYALQLQRLDRWHAPIHPTAIELKRNQEHEHALDRLFTVGRINSNAPHGTVIFRESFDTPFLRSEELLEWAANPDPLAIVNSMLETCAYLPPNVRACDPDSGAGQLGRTVALEVRRFPAGSIPHRQFRNDLRIAIAPVLEAQSDAELWVNGNQFSIHPTITEARFVEIIRNSIDAGADLLLLPEMSVDEVLLPSLKNAIVQQRREFFDRTDEAPRLSFVICGVLRKRSNSSPKHRNYIAVLDSDGSILFEQDKLSHWNLSEDQQRRFGVYGAYPVPLLEDTIPGASIIISELPGLGRLLTLICADMFANEPGDWVADNIGLDWIHAPIMDGSTCWTQGQGGPWIINRAERAARGGTATIITNSMTLTQWNNAVIEQERKRDPAYKYKCYNECGVGLAAAPQGSSVMMQHLMVPVSGAHTPVVCLIKWNEGWTPFPPAGP